MGANAVPSASANMAQLLSDTALSRAKAGTSLATARNSVSSASAASTDPVDILDLSVRAKAMLERNKGDQLVADRLDVLFAITKMDQELETKRSNSALEWGGGFSGQSASKQQATRQSRNLLVSQYLSSLYRSAKGA